MRLKYEPASESLNMGGPTEIATNFGAKCAGIALVARCIALSPNAESRYRCEDWVLDGPASGEPGSMGRN